MRPSTASNASERDPNGRRAGGGRRACAPRCHGPAGPGYVWPPPWSAERALSGGAGNAGNAGGTGAGGATLARTSVMAAFRGLITRLLRAGGADPASAAAAGAVANVREAASGARALRPPALRPPAPGPPALRAPSLRAPALRAPALGPPALGPPALRPPAGRAATLKAIRKAISRVSAVSGPTFFAIRKL